jgi:uracil-DNA glycosylase family 4
MMFVAEAPGRFGADRSGIPLHGDATGRNFEWLLSASGFRRSEVYVTNAVLCNPVDGGGRNAPPTTTEICNCAHFLRVQIEAVDPLLVVTLGAVALRAVGLIYRTALNLPSHHRKVVDLHGRLLVPLFHPSPRVMNTRRPRGEQLKDFEFARQVLDRALRAVMSADDARLSGARLEREFPTHKILEPSKIRVR